MRAPIHMLHTLYIYTYIVWHTHIVYIIYISNLIVDITLTYIHECIRIYEFYHWLSFPASCYHRFKAHFHMCAYTMKWGYLLGCWTFESELFDTISLVVVLNSEANLWTNVRKWNQVPNVIVTISYNIHFIAFHTNKLYNNKIFTHTHMNFDAWYRGN